MCVGFFKRLWGGKRTLKKHLPDIMQVGFSNAPCGDEECWDSCRSETGERRWLNFYKHKELVEEENILVDKFDVQE